MNYIRLISLSYIFVFTGCSEVREDIKLIEDSKLEEEVESLAEDLIEEALGIGVKIDLSPEAKEHRENPD